MDPKKQITITVGELMDLQAMQNSAERAQLVTKIYSRNEAIMSDSRPWFMIPTPMVAPLGVPADKREFVQEVWDVFIKPTQQDNAPLQSAEDRVLMAILRAVYEGMAE